jgi:hypothetical protein
VAAGLTLATKETSIIVLPAALASCLLARLSLRGAGLALRKPRGGWGTAAATAGAIAAIVAALFYSSFLAAPAAALEPFRAVATYLDRGIDPARHAQPWHYYLGLLTYFSSGGLRWSEGVVLALAAVGTSVAWRAGDVSRPERAFWARHLAGYTLATAAVYSAIRYKTPWNLLPFYAGTLVLAGIGFSRLVHARSSRAFRGALLTAFLLASAHLGLQAWRASVVYPADPRNPYVHAQTVPDAVRMATRIRALAALHPDGDHMLVAVVAHPYEQWPLPWYLRSMPRVGYWTSPGDALAAAAPVVVTSMEHTAAVDAALGDRYVSEFYGLRPAVLLALHVEQDLWNRFLEQRASGIPASTSAR